MEEESLIPRKTSARFYPLLPLNTAWLCFLTVLCSVGLKPSHLTALVLSLSLYLPVSTPSIYLSLFSSGPLFLLLLCPLSAFLLSLPYFLSLRDIKRKGRDFAVPGRSIASLNPFMVSSVLTQWASQLSQIRVISHGLNVHVCV